MEGEPAVILLVEDNVDHAELILRCLKEHGVRNRIQHVMDGEAALNYLFRRGEYADAERSPCPDVILLDLRLPKIDGLEVLNTIKADEQLRAIPVVILTSSAAERDVDTAYNRHVNSYIVKPLDFQQLTRLMTDLGFYWLLWNRRTKP